MTHASSPLLHADRLSVARGDALLIEELSFALQPGEALHVLGENGAGKSTLLLALAGLIPLASGTVAVDRDALAFLGHDNGLLPDLSVAENMALYAGSGVVADPQTCEAMEISKLSAKPARTLSFGQARRVALALTCTLPQRPARLRGAARPSQQRGDDPTDAESVPSGGLVHPSSAAGEPSVGACEPCRA